MSGCSSIPGLGAKVPNTVRHSQKVKIFKKGKMKIHFFPIDDKESATLMAFAAHGSRKSEKKGATLNTDKCSTTSNST